jgi:GT2 family glycosyltransferase
MIPPPLVSVIVVAWNSTAHLPHCLQALSNQTMEDFEVILIDNGSTDGAVDSLEPDNFNFNLIIEKFSINRGFAAANNAGVQLARGKWIALLNADAFPEADWLEQLICAADNNPAFNFFSSRQIQANNPDFLDGAGDVYHISGLAWREYYNQPEKIYGLQSKEVFSACAAAALYMREEFLKADGFDEDYFSYFEDVDLSFRLRLLGGRCLYVPEALVHHVGSASTGKASDFSFYYGHRNLVWTFFKNMPFWLFWFYLPVHMGMNIYLSLSFLLKDGRSVVLKSKLDAVLALPAILRKRKNAQKMRIVSSRDIYRVMSKDIFAPHRASRARTQKE